MAKRLAESQLTPEMLAEQLNDDGEVDRNNQNGPAIADQATLEQRKIVRVKRHQQNGKVETEEGKGGVFKLIGSLDTNDSKAKLATGVAAPLFKPINFVQSFGGQNIPVAPVSQTTASAEKPPLFQPVKQTGDSVFDKKPEPVESPKPKESQTATEKKEVANDAQKETTDKQVATP